ncbi:hypothetical protein JCM21900_000988 [Sporobolomyces salmonicolor]
MLPPLPFLLRASLRLVLRLFPPIEPPHPLMLLPALASEFESLLPRRRLVLHPLLLLRAMLLGRSNPSFPLLLLFLLLRQHGPLVPELAPLLPLDRDCLMSLELVLPPRSRLPLTPPLLVRIPHPRSDVALIRGLARLVRARLLVVPMLLLHSPEVRRFLRFNPLLLFVRFAATLLLLRKPMLLLFVPTLLFACPGKMRLCFRLLGSGLCEPAFGALDLRAC